MGSIESLIKLPTFSIFSSTDKKNENVIKKNISGVLISFEQFCEFATENSFPEPSYEKYEAFLRANSSPYFRVRAKQEAAMFFAHVLQETGGYKLLAEQNPSPGAYGFMSQYPYQEYYGRGYLQLSWSGNYSDASANLNLRHPKVVESKEALLANPSRVEEDETLAWRTALWFWSNRVRTQCDLSKFRFGETTKLINPIECQNPEQFHSNTEKKKEVEILNSKAKSRFRYYANNLEVLGITEAPIEGGCYN